MRRGKSRKGKPFRLFCRKRGGDPAGPPVRRLRARTAGRAGAWAGAFPRRGRYLPADWRGRKSGTAGPVPDFCMGARKNRAGRRRYPQGACRRGGRDSQNAQVELPAARAGRQRTAGACAGLTGGRRAPAPVPAAANKNGPGCKNAARPVFCIRYFLFAVFPGFVFWGCAVCACAASSSGFKNWPV